MEDERICVQDELHLRKASAEEFFLSLIISSRISLALLYFAIDPTESAMSGKGLIRIPLSCLLECQHSPLPEAVFFPVSGRHSCLTLSGDLRAMHTYSLLKSKYNAQRKI